MPSVKNAPSSFVPFWFSDARVGRVTIGWGKDKTWTHDTAKIHKRAWTLQEQLLSRRVVLYTKDQLHWSCRQLCIADEGTQIPYLDLQESTLSLFGLSEVSKEDRAGFRSKAAFQGDLRYHQDHQNSNGEVLSYGNDSQLNWKRPWPEPLSEYFSRNCSDPRDRLRAIDGLAQRVGAQWDVTYLYVLWKEDALKGLAWSWKGETTSENAKWLHPLRRPSWIDAPSWPGAFIDYRCGLRDLNDMPLCEMIAVRHDPQSGRTNGVLELRGPPLRPWDIKGRQWSSSPISMPFEMRSKRHWEMKKGECNVSADTPWRSHQHQNDPYG